MGNNESQPLIKRINWQKVKRENDTPFLWDPLHANPEEYQETDPKEEHRTQSTYHLHSLFEEPEASAAHQSMPSSLNSYSPPSSFTLPPSSASLCPQNKNSKLDSTGSQKSQFDHHPHKKILQNNDLTRKSHV